jgi:hypothetical protein
METDYSFHIFKDGIFDKSDILQKDFVDFDLKKDMIKTELIGFLNITHRLEKDKNGKERLVEIPRKEFEVDDVVKFERAKNKIGVIVNKDNKKYLNYNGDINNDYLVFYKHFCYLLISEKFKKLGILGVNYEFVNDKIMEK